MRAVIHFILRHLHPHPVGQEADGLHVVQVFYAADKGDHVPPCPAAEAVEGLVLGVDGKGRGLFGVEGAQPGEIAAPPAQLYIAADDLFRIAAVFQFIQKTFRQHDRSPPCSFLYLPPAHIPQGLGMKNSSNTATQ